MKKKTSIVVVVVVVIACIVLGLVYWHNRQRNIRHMNRIKEGYERELEKRVKDRIAIDSLDRVVSEARKVEEQLQHVADSLGVSYEQALLWRHAILNRPRSRSAVALRDSILRASGQHRR